MTSYLGFEILESASNETLVELFYNAHTFNNFIIIQLL